jgi:hypothetical protein
MSLDAVTTTPPRVSIANVSTGESITVPRNPQEFAAEVRAEYGQFAIQGAGYRPLQFAGTANPTFPMVFQYIVSDRREAEMLVEHKRFFMSLEYPRRGAGSVLHQAPPRALVIWAGVVALECVVKVVAMKDTRFNSAGQSVEATITVNFEEVRDGAIFSEDVAAQGLLRASPRALGGRGD